MPGSGWSSRRSSWAWRSAWSSARACSAGFSLRRLFGLTITAAAVPLALIGLVPNLIMVTVFVIVLGALAGIAYATGFTIVGLEVDDDTRGRVFAFFLSSIQVILLTVITVVAFLSAAFTKLIAGATGSGDVKFAHVVYTSVGQNVVILLAAALAAFLGVKSYRQMDDRKGVPLREDLLAAIRGEPPAPVPAAAHANGSAAAPAARAADRVRGRGGLGQDHAGPADLDLAARARLRRGDHARARRDQGRDAAARAAARHRAHRHVTARRGADVRGRPGRARRLGHRARAGPGRDRHHRPVRGLLAGLPGRRGGTCRSRRSPGSTGGRPAGACPT